MEKMLLIENAILINNRKGDWNRHWGKNLPKKTRTTRKQSDDRITIKIDKKLWKAISDLIKHHPEWGIGSVSEFIRRAVDNELGSRMRTSERKVIEINLRPQNSPKDSQDKDP